MNITQIKTKLDAGEAVTLPDGVVLTPIGGGMIRVSVNGELMDIVFVDDLTLDLVADAVKKSRAPIQDSHGIADNSIKRSNRRPK